MSKKKIFISFDYDNDKDYKNLLLAWDANSDFDFSLYNASLNVPIDSSDATTIKKVISTRIKDATYLLCIIGKNSHKSEWIAWEIKKALELNKKLVAVKIDSEYTSPSAILNVGASWAMSFTFDSIKSAIEAAK